MGNNVNLYMTFFLEWWEMYVNLFMEKWNTLLCSVELFKTEVFFFLIKEKI